MRIAYLRTHLHSALSLYRQREQLQQAWMIPAATLENLEQRLSIHIEALAGAGHREEAPGRPCAAFVAAACSLLRGDDGAADTAIARAEEQPELMPAVVDALTLYPPTDIVAWIERSYHERSAARPALLEIARRTAAAVSPALLVQAELHSAAPALQESALRCAAEQARFSTELFRPYYRGSPPAVQATALYAGLLRNDAEVGQALLRACQRADEAARPELLRLMALSGAPEFWPVLEAAAAQTVEHLPLLAVYGRKAVVPVLLKALAHPRSAPFAERAWQLLVGASVPRRARLELVQDDKHQPLPHGDMPDTAQADGQWRTLEWADDQRLLLGRPHTQAWLAAAAMAHGGAAGRHCLNLLACTGAEPVDDRGWVACRRLRLAGFAASTAERQAYA